METMRGRLDRVKPVGIEPSISRRVDVPRAAAARRTGERGVHVYVTSAGIEIEGELTPPSGVADAIAREQFLLGEGKPKDIPVYVHAEPPLGAATIFEVAASSPDSRARLIVAIDDPRKLPYKELSTRVRTALEPIRAEREPSKRATILAHEIQGSISTCAELVKTFGDLAGMIGEKRDEAMRKWSPNAIESCRCKGLDVDLYEGLLLVALDSGSPLGWLEMRKTIAPIADETVAQLAKRLESAP